MEVRLSGFFGASAFEFTPRKLLGYNRKLAGRLQLGLVGFGGHRPRPGSMHLGQQQGLQQAAVVFSLRAPEHNCSPKP